MIFYVYVVFRPDGRPLYVGKGSGARWRRHDRKSRNPHYASAYEAAGGDLPVALIREGLTEAEAYEAEEAFIRAIGIESNGGPLVNLGYGGEGGPAGVKRSAEFKQTRRERAREAWQDPDFRQMMLGRRKSPGNRQPRSEELRQHLSMVMKGNQHTLGYVPKPENIERTMEFVRGSKWINNGSQRRRLQAGVELPAGWSFGKRL